MHDDIGLILGAVFCLEAGLNFILPALHQAGFLQYRFQNKLTPTTLGLVISLQRIGQVDRIGTDLVVQLLQVFNFLGQGEALLGFLVVGLLNPFFKLCDFILQRREYGGETVFVFLQEIFALVFEYFVREIFERRT